LLAGPGASTSTHAQYDVGSDTLHPLLAGLHDGRVYRSTDGGVTWQASGVGMADGAIYPLTAGAGLTIYAAPGNSGVYVSTDSGKTWHDDNGIGGPSSQAVYGLAVDPGDGEIIFAIDDQGNFYRSQDSGAHWNSRPSPLSEFSQSTANALVVDPLRPATMLITSDTGMAVSTNAGQTWAMASGLPDGTEVFSAAFSGASADVAYAATSNGIYQTTDGGAAWLAENRGIAAGSVLKVVAVDPANASTVVAFSADGTFYRSTNGATAWHEVGSADVGAPDSLTFDAAHPGVVLAGTDQGMLYISTDHGASWRRSDPGFGSTSIDSLSAAVRRSLPTDGVAAPPAGSPGLSYVGATHHIVSGAFLAFYQRYGSLRIFGLPLTEAFVEKGMKVQYFERAEMVLKQGVVQLAPLGTRLTATRHFPPGTSAANSATRLFFPATEHSLSGRFLTFWQAHNGQLIYGPPISEPLHEQNGDGTGRSYLVQYFANGRLEYHPELSGTSYVVTAGQVGRQTLQRRGWL
jgi:photosystem II stability/assembly factor-like uncharacterized protein